MSADKLSQLRHEQRMLDKALARRARAKKALDTAEEGVRIARKCADTIMRELQMELAYRGAPGNGALDPAPPAPGELEQAIDSAIAVEYRAYLCTVCGDTHNTIREPVLFNSHRGHALRQEETPHGA